MDSAIIQVAIGLFFVYSLLALIVTQLNTFVSSVLQWRSKNLKEGLQNLVTDKKIQAWLLTHPLIDMVKAELDPSQKLEDQLDHITQSETSDVMYIAPDTFVDAVIDILLVEADRLYRPLQNAVEHIPNPEHRSIMRELVRTLRNGYSEQTLRSLRDAAEVVQDPAVKQEIIDALKRIEEALRKLNFKSDQIVPILEGVSKIKDTRFRSALETLLVSAKTLDDARVKLENWFDDGMTRAGEIFKKRMVYISLIVSLIVAVVLNVDTLYLARSLWDSPDLRLALAEAAIEFDQGAAQQIIKPDETGEDPTAEELRQQAEDIGETIQSLLELQLPIGWEFTPVTEEMVTASRLLGQPDPMTNSRNIWNLVPGNSSNWASLWLQKIIGILATTIAAAQGAPFWFDLLNRVSGSQRSSSTTTGNKESGTAKPA